MEPREKRVVSARNKREIRNHPISLSVALCAKDSAVWDVTQAQ